MKKLLDNALQWHYCNARIDLRVYRLDALYIEAIEQLSQDTLSSLKATYKNSKRQREKIASEYLIPQLLPHGVQLAYTPSGRPYLLGSELYISITHNEEYIAVALATESIGIDVEQESQQLVRVAPRFFNYEELRLAHVSKIPLAVLWSAKEAIYKWANQPGLSPLQDISLSELRWTTQSSITLRAALYGDVLQTSIYVIAIDNTTYLSYCLS